MSDAAPAPAPLTFLQKVEKSSQVCYCNYNPATFELSVIFRGSPGKLYLYSDFPAAIWDELKAAESLGSFLYRRVTRPLPGEPGPPYAYRWVETKPGALVQPTDVP